MKKKLFIIFCETALAVALCVGCGDKDNNNMDNPSTVPNQSEVTTEYFNEDMTEDMSGDSFGEDLSEDMTEIESKIGNGVKDIAKGAEDTVNEAVSKVE